HSPWEDTMRRWSIALAAFLTLALAFPQTSNAQNAAALTGQVSAPDGAAMEGVLVSAKKAGSNITVTVVSDAQGRFSFPASKLHPGAYALSTRAVGYELEGPKTAAIAAGQAADIDVKLRKTKKLSAQLTNAEWIASMPGTEQQKQIFLGCVGCHTLER